MFKIATWNVNSLRVRLPHVLKWLETARPDMLTLQETKLQDGDFPAADFESMGYQCLFSGQKTYNGVAMLSRGAADDVVTALPGMDDPQKRLLCATVDGIRVVNVYVPNGASVGSDKYAYKLQWLRNLAAFIQAQLQQHPRLVLLGDFNIAPGDEDVHDPEQWREKILCSTPERAAFQALLDTGLEDTYRLFPREEREFTWWDYRMAAFRRNLGLRIDLILASRPLAALCSSSTIDKEPRRWERPSDHAPVMAEFDV